MKLNGYNVDSSKLFLRTSDDGVSYGNFKRKEVGVWNKSENWTGIPTCDKCNGFFGIDKEFNNFGIIREQATIELCEWRGKRVAIDNDKICVSKYRVVAINENIPNKYFEECGYKVLKEGDFQEKISGNRWIIFGGKIDKITGGVQYFYKESSAGNAEITDGYQHFYNNSSAENAKISGGRQYFSDDSAAGNAKITGGMQYFYNRL